MRTTTLALAPLIPLAALALACTSPDSTAPPLDSRARVHGSLPDPVRPEPPAIAADQLVLVPQLAISGPEHWRVEPGAGRVAALLSPTECGVWQLELGDFLGFAAGGPEAEPCRTWAPLEPIVLSDGQSEGERTLMHPDGQRQLIITGGRFELGGAKPLGRSLAGDRRYRAAAFEPSGARLALLVADARAAMTVEVWELARGRLVHELEITPQPLARPTGFALRWTDRSLLAIVHTEPVCAKPNDSRCIDNFGPGFGDSWTVDAWAELDDEPHRRRLPEYESQETRINTLFLDPDQRWLIGVHETLAPREGTELAFESIPLPGGGEAKLGLAWHAYASEREPEQYQAVSEWSNDVGSSFVSIVDYTTGYYPAASVTWRMTSLIGLRDGQAKIDLSFAEGIVVEGGYEVETAWRLALIGRDQILAETDLCPSATMIEEAKSMGDPIPACAQERFAPPECSLVDASWAFDRVLLRCGDRWMIEPVPERSASPVLTNAVELARGTGEPHSVAWGPSGLAIWTFADGLRLFHGSELVAKHPKVRALHRAILDEELDLALIREDKGLRVVDLDAAELGPTLAWTERVEFAAFASDRSTLAVAGEGEIAVFLRSESQPIARWRTGPIAGLAFRQDGQVLYVGATRPLPELALDPNSGALIESAQLDREAFERIAAAELDPSWRWAIEEDGTIVRTLDGQALRLGLGEDTAILESGWFAGEADALTGYRARLGSDSPSPVYSFTALADQLARPQLIDEFLLGKPLPLPRVTLPAP